MKLIIRFLLSLCFIFLVEHGRLDAYAYQKNDSHALTKDFGCANQVGFYASQNDCSQIVSKEKEQDKIEDWLSRYKEEDDEEVDKKFSFGKQIKSGNYFDIFFHAQAPGYFSGYINSPSSFSVRFLAPSTSKHIVLRVFRI